MLNLLYALHQLLCGSSLWGRYDCHWPWTTRKLRFGQVKQFSQAHPESLHSQCELLLLTPSSYIFSLPPSEFFPSRNNPSRQLFMNSTNIFESFYTRLCTTYKGSCNKLGRSHRTLCFLLKNYYVLISYMNTMYLNHIYPQLSLCNLWITSPIPFAISRQGLPLPHFLCLLSCSSSFFLTHLVYLVFLICA